VQGPGASKENKVRISGVLKYCVFKKPEPQQEFGLRKEKRKKTRGSQVWTIQAWR
jgi:hypothetical protein